MDPSLRHEADHPIPYSGRKVAKLIHARFNGHDAPPNETCPWPQRLAIGFSILDLVYETDSHTLCSDLQ